MDGNCLTDFPWPQTGVEVPTGWRPTPKDTKEGTESIFTRCLFTANGAKPENDKCVASHQASCSSAVVETKPSLACFSRLGELSGR